MRSWAVLAAILLAGCGPYPRDTEGTLQRIESEHALRVGFTDLEPRHLAAASRYVERLEQATGARAAIDTGSADGQLARLESGELDLVVGEFADDSPWMSEFAILEPLSRRRAGERKLGLAPVALNGENRWIALLEREVRDTLAEARR